MQYEFKVSSDSGIVTTFEVVAPRETLPRGMNFERDWTLMQFTGLKDKNGREIYEGDIVNCADLGPLDLPLIKRTGHIEYEPNTCTFGVWVDWTNFGTSNNAEARALCPMGHFRLSEYEVVGNIYQNPDLIGGSVG